MSERSTVQVIESSTIRHRHTRLTPLPLVRVAPGRPNYDGVLRNDTASAASAPYLDAATGPTRIGSRFAHRPVDPAEKTRPEGRRDLSAVGRRGDEGGCASTPQSKGKFETGGQCGSTGTQKRATSAAMARRSIRNRVTPRRSACCNPGSVCLHCGTGRGIAAAGLDRDQGLSQVH